MAPSHSTPELRLSARGDSTGARLAGCSSLTDTNSETVGRQLSELATGHSGHLVLDLAEVEFLTSGPLGKLVSVHRAVKAAGGRLTLENAKPMVREVFAVTRLDRLLDVQPASGSNNAA
jgi:anti-anti-sigma factor